jgi:fibronectin-binding autotransporter adhesin
MSIRQSAIRFGMVIMLGLSAIGEAATLSWTGGVNNLWSVGGNWTGGVVPVAGDSLNFPTGALHTSMSNDLPAGLAVQAMTFPSTTWGYFVDGNGIVLSGGLTSHCCPQNFFIAPMKLGASQTFQTGGITKFEGPIDLNGFTLTLVPSSTTISGSIEGSGNVVIDPGGSVALSGTSTFTGTLTANADVNLSGSLSNADFVANATTVKGSGSVKTATLNDTNLLIGPDPNGCCSDNHSLGIFSTGDLTLNGGSLHVDLVTPTPGTGYDQVNTTGSVTLANVSLHVSLPSTVPAVGQSFIIVDNDGSDAIVGTFNGLAEGAIFTVGTTQFRITYVGGTGNDVVLTAVGATAKSWTGAVSNIWSVGGNWTGGVAPIAGDALNFPTGAQHTSMMNDLPAGLVVQGMTFPSTTWGYFVDGNGLVLSGGLSTQCCPQNFFIAPIKLGASQTFATDGITKFQGPIDLNGFTLTVVPSSTTISGSILGSGDVAINPGGEVTLSGASTFTGTLTTSSGLNLSGSLSSASFVANATTVIASGSLKTATLNDTTLLIGSDPNGCCNENHSLGILSIGDLTLNGGSLHVDLVTPTPGAGYDEVNTTGTVTLANVSLQVSLPSAAPATGQSFVIVDNDGSDAIAGTFNGLAEGAVFTAGTTQFRITYAGGTGNDIVLTVVGATAKSWTGAVNNLWSVGGNWTGGVAPVAGDALNFPTGVLHTNMTNDLPAGLAVQRMTFPSTTWGYFLDGNAIVLYGGLSAPCCPPNFFMVPIKLGAAETFELGGTTKFEGPIDLNGFALTVVPSSTTISSPIVGSGNVVINPGGQVTLSGASTFTGTLTASGGVNLSGSLSNASFVANATTVIGGGSLKTATLNNTSLLIGDDPNGCCNDNHSLGILSTGNLTLNGGSLHVDLVTPTPGTGYDQVNTTGTVALSNVALQVSLPSAVPTLGQSFVILNNDGSDPVTGTFTGMPEGSTFAVGPTYFRISYAGGTGNDIVLTAVVAPPIPVLGAEALVMLAALLALVALRTLR